MMLSSRWLAVYLASLLALLGCSRSAKESIPNAAKMAVLEQLRIDFPQRCGLTLNNVLGEPEHRANVQISRSADGENWRVTYGQKTETGDYDYLVYETLVGPSDGTQVHSFGTSHGGLNGFAEDPELKPRPSRFEGSLEETGGGRLLRHELLFGLVPNHKGLADLHSETFAEQASLQSNSDGSFDLVHGPSGVRFRYSSDYQCKSVTLPEYSVDAKGTLSVNFFWQLTPNHNQRCENGGLLGFEVERSTRGPTETWFAEATISELRASEKLSEFKFVRVGAGISDGMDESTKLSGVDKRAAEIFESAGVPFKAGEFEQALELIREAIALNPDQPRYRAGLLQMLQSAGIEQASRGDQEAANRHFYEAGEIAHSALQEKELPPSFKEQRVANAIYNEASAYALDGKSVDAIESLKIAIAVGEFDFDHLRENVAFEELRADANFRWFVETAKTQQQTRARATLASAIAEFETFDFYFELKSVDGAEIKLHDYKGKLVIVDIWGTWCPPCREGIPHLIELSHQYSDRGLEIVGINYENLSEEDARGRITEFIAENKINYPCVFGDKKTRSQIPNFGGYPTTLFIGLDGQVKFQLVGAQSYSKLESVVTLLLQDQP